MRILHLLSQTQLTGAEVYAAELVQFQMAAGHSVFLISDKIHIAFAVENKSLPISKNSFRHKLQVRQVLRKFLVENNIQVIHCHSRAAVRHASRARRGLDVAMVTTIHGKQHDSLSKRIFDSWGEYKILICENLRRQFTTDFGITAATLKLIRNPFSLPNSEHTEHLEHTEQLPNKKIAFVGRSTGPKGERFKIFFQQGLKAWITTHPDYQLDIIASNPELMGEDFLAELKTLAPQVKLLGHVEDLATKLRNYSLVIGAGRVAIEACLNGLPVLAFGEALSHGLITTRNLASALASNFGDIAEDLGEPVNSKLLLDDLERVLSIKNQNLADREAIRIQIKKEFSGPGINAQILDIYKAAAFKRNQGNKWLPILMYHKIPDAELLSKHRIFVTKANFRNHLRFFQRQGFKSLTFDELAEFWESADYRLFPKRPLILTFDDGYLDNLTNALPLLREFQFKAQIFLLADHSIQSNTWDAGTGEAPSPLMTLSQKLEVAASDIFNIGSHSLQHKDLTQLSDSEVLHQLRESKLALEKDFNCTVNVIAYPFGHIDPRLPALARTAGYSFAVNTDRGGLSLADEPLSIFRANIFPEESVFSLWKKTRPWYRRYYYKKRNQ